MSVKAVVIGIVSFGWFYSCGSPAQQSNKPDNQNGTEQNVMSEKLDTATFGSGCFWCTEAIFESLEGVVSATSGYMGGQKPNPTYKEVCSGTTGHAEVVQVVYDPKKITYELLLEAFWASHDPTTLNRAKEIKADLISRGVFDQLIVTEITTAGTFYPAESYHQEYYELNGSEPYCQFVIRPKMEKFKKAFSDRLKK